MDILIDEFRKDLGDGQLNRIKAQKDFVIFREEQKAIAYKMMSDRSAPIDFGVFCEKLYAERDVAPANRWLTMSVKFFPKLKEKKISDV